MAAKTEPLKLPFLKQEAFHTVFENGHTFVYVPKKGEVFNVSTWVRTGSLHEDDEINGISHFLEHLMFKGTERFGPGEFDKAMESMGCVINAATWKDFTFYYINGPKGPENSNFDKALDLHGDMMTCVTLPDEEIGPQYDPTDADYKGEKRERSVVIEEIGMREDQPWTKVYNAVNSLMYPEGFPYRRDVIGTRQIVGQVSRDTIVNYYQKWYAPENFITIVVGDFDHAELSDKVKKAFKFTPTKAAVPINQLPFAAPKPQTVVQSGDYQTSFFITGYHSPRPQNLKETIAIDIVSHALGEGRSSRMTQALVEKPKEPIFTFVGCGQSTFKLGNTFYVQGNFIHPDKDVALKQVFDEIENLIHKEPVTEQELTNAVKKLKVDFAETSETTSGIAETIGEALTVVEDISYYADYLNVLESITLADVHQAAKTYLTPDKAYTAILVPTAQAVEKTPVAA